jgi:hypothetical protein
VRRQPRRRLTTVRLLSVALALLAVTTWGWAGGRAGAQSAGTPPIALTLVGQTNWVGPESVYRVAFTATGLPAGATVGGVLHEKVRDRVTLEAAAAGETPGKEIFNIPPKPVAQLTGPDGAIVVSLPVSTASSTPDVAPLAAAGVYPFSIHVFDAAGKPVAELVTTLLRLGGTASGTTTSTLAVGVVVPIQADTVPGPDGSPTLDDTAAGQLTETIAAVTGQPGLPLTLSPSPESLHLLEASGPRGAATVAALQNRAGRQVLANPFAPIDTGSWMDSGLVNELDDQYASGTNALQETFASHPSEKVAVLDRTVTSTALDHLRTRGVETVVAPSGQLTPLTNGTTNATFASRFEIATGDGTTVGAVAGDDPAALRLTNGTDPVLAGHQALAELAYLHLADDGAARGIAVVVPTATDPRALTTFLGGLADANGALSGSIGAPMVSPVTLDQLFSATATATTGGNRPTPLVRGYEADTPAGLGRYPTNLRAARVSLGGLQTLVPTAAELTTPVAETLLSSGARNLDSGGRDTMVGAAERSIEDITGEIVVTPEQIVTLTSSSGNVPLNLENRLQYPASVRIVLNSAKLDFPAGSVIEQTIAPAQTTTISLPVETRASGAFPLTAEISSANGDLPVATTRYTVRSTAISGVGLVLSVGAGLFLLVWWGRHFRTSRRARKLVASNHPALSGTEPDGYAPPDTDRPEPDPLEGR